MEDSDALHLNRKAMFVQLVHTLDSGLSDLQQDLHTVASYQSASDLSPDDISFVDATLRYRIHEFNLACDLAASNPEQMFDGDITYGPHNTALTVDAIEESLIEAREQFQDVVVPAVSTLLDDPTSETEWQQFYGQGLGWSHRYTVSHLESALVKDLRAAAEDAGLDPTDFLPSGVIEEDHSDAPADTIDDDARKQAEEDQTSEPDAPDELPVGDADDSDAHTTESSRPSDDAEETDDDGLIRKDSRPPGKYTVLSVELPGKQPKHRPDCCSAGSPVNAKYDVICDTPEGKAAYPSCATHVPDKARGIAPGFRFWTMGDKLSGDGPSSTLTVGHDGRSWTERHFIGDHNTPEGQQARLRYKLNRDTIYIDVYDHTHDEHGREGRYSVDVDDFDGGVPIVEGKPIHEWLGQRAEAHFERIHENDGVDKHLVSIDRDMRVVKRAQRAYRKKNPDFEQPAGMINDHTPIVEDCITECSNCGEIVAGTTLDNAEPCEYCGCDEAEWGGPSQSDTTKDDSDQQGQTAQP